MQIKEGNKQLVRNNHYALANIGYCSLKYMQLITSTYRCKIINKIFNTPRSHGLLVNPYCLV